MTAEAKDVRLTGVLGALEIARSTWYRKPIPEDERRRPGPAPSVIPQEIIDAVVKMATENPCVVRIFFPDWHLNGISDSIRFPGWAAALRQPGAELVRRLDTQPAPD